ncbi:MAG: hypothetical protein P8009_10365 [Gammaproteobacteria bacterium]
MPVLIDELIAEVEAPGGTETGAAHSAEAPVPAGESPEQRMLRALQIAEERRQRLTVD